MPLRPASVPGEGQAERMRSSPTVLEAHSPRDLLDLLPALTDHDLTESLLCLSFSGTRSGTGIRVDLPSSEGESAWVMSVLRLVLRFPGQPRVLIVLTTSVRPDPPLSPLARRLQLTLRAAGCELVDLLWQGEHSWGSYLDGVVHEQPSWRPPLSLPELPPFGPDPVPPATAEERLALANQLAKTGSVRPNERLLRALDLSLDPASDSIEHALVLRSLESARFRELALLHWVFGVGPELCRAWRSNVSDVPERTVCSRFLAPTTGRPEWERLRLARGACQRLRELGPTAYRASLLTIEAWMLWASGYSTRADALLDESLRAEPRDELAQPLRALIRAGQVPGWGLG